MEDLENTLQNKVKESLDETLTTGEMKKIASEIRSALFALICLVVGTLHKSWYPDQQVVSVMIYLVGIVIEMAPVVVKAFKGFIGPKITNTIDILVTVAIAASIVDGKYEVAILIPAILTVVHFFEERSIMGGKDAIEGLKRIQSDTALIMTEDGEKEVNARELKIGDRIIVKPGMAFPIDGTVVNGFSSVDQKSLTGEPLPMQVTPGDTVYAGTVNINGVLTVKVEKEFEDTSFSKIVELLQEAQGITVPEMRIVDKFITYYLPVVIVIAVVVAFITMDMSKAVAILIVSCPCAQMLISSAPMIAALAVATRRGVLIKSSKFIENLADIDMVIFDKTGTITKGCLTINGYKLQDASSYEELIDAAACVAQGSLHPISMAIMSEVTDNKYDADMTTEEVVGKGLKGVKGSSEVLFGNRRWMNELGYQLDEEPENIGPINWVVKDSKVLGCIMFGDSPREEAADAVQELKNMGIKETEILTGDNKEATEKIKNMVGIDTVHAELMPAQKLEYVKEAKESNKVMVVGDGINDALALADADVGVAMGAMGSDTAIKSADIALMNNNLKNIPFVIDLSRSTRAIIYQNIIIAFGSSFIMIMLAAGGLVSAVAGAIFHNVGAFIVLLNSSRLMRKFSKED